MRRRIPVSLLIVFLLMLSAVSLAQVATVDDTTRTPIQGAGHDYIHSLSETVDPSNGSVSLRIQFPTPAGRGLTIPFSFGYDSGSVHHLEGNFYPYYGTAHWAVKPDALNQGGWSNSFPTVRYDTWEQDVSVVTGYNGSGPIYTNYPCYYATNYVFRDLSGGLHSLNLGSLTWGSIPPPGGCPWGGPGPVSSGGDAQFVGVLPTQGIPPGPVTVYDNAGTVYAPTYIEDRNGNRVNLTGSTTTNNQGMYITGYTAVTDTLGRTLISGNGIGAAGTTQTVVIAGQTYQIIWASAAAGASIPSTWVGNTQGPNSQFDTCSPVPAMNDTQPVVSAITLPNGKQFHFYYNNPYGLLSGIDYPSGAWARYTWKLSDNANELADYPGFYWSSCGPASCAAAASDGCLYQYQSPVVATRTVGVGGSAVLTQTFTYHTYWAPATNGNVGGTSWTSKTTSVTALDNVTGKSTLTSYAYSPVSLPTPSFSNTTIVQQAPVENIIKYYDWANTTSPIRTVNKTWQDLYHLKSEQTIIAATGQSTTTNYAYTTSARFVMPQEKDEFNFGVSPPSPPSRKTVTTYQAFSGTPGILADAPCKIVTSDSTGTAVSEIDYLYDGGSSNCAPLSSAPVLPIAVSPAVPAGTHDPAFEGTAVPRGNVTKKIRWLNGGTSPTTTYKYDETGHVLFSTDACGNTTCSDMTGTSHTTSYSYADAYTTLSGGSNTSFPPPNGATNAYLTQVTDALGHTASFTYDYYNGQLTSSKDPNNQVTTYIYSDAFARPTQANYPDGGQTSIAYNDAAYNPSANTPSVTTTQKITSTLNHVSLAATDGVGHVVRTILTDPDPAGADTTDTTYDGFGRVLTQSNPHRSGSSLTDGTTTYTYDGLGRTTQVSKQDGSITKTSYDQAGTNSTSICTTVYDEAGKVRKSCSDGLGRLLEVDEPGANSGSGTAGVGTITVSGGVQPSYNPCQHNVPPAPTNCPQYDQGAVYVTISSFTVSASYGGSNNLSTSIASALATGLNASGSPVTAVASGNTITVTSRTLGSSSNFSVSSYTTWQTQYYSSPSYTAYSPGLTGGTDGLGSNPLVTLYNYKITDDLLCVWQKGTDTTSPVFSYDPVSNTSNCVSAAPAAWRPRSFVYDSLSRLTQATNPESGTIFYAYDANGNLQTKVSPAPNQTGTATVTTCFGNWNGTSCNGTGYDVLNRLTQKSYSDGVTPSVYFYYDLVNPWGTSYPYNYIGRLNATAVYGSSNNLMTSSYLHYDPMGRVITEAQCTPSSCPSNAPSPASHTTYTYDLSGNLTTEGTAEFGPTISYAYNGAARPTQVTSNLVDSQHPATLLTINSYSPAGALTQMTYGNGQLESRAYNNRLQPTEFKSYNSSNFVRYDFTYGYNTGSNNGNVMSWNSTGWDFVFNRSYTYDSLNRLATLADSNSGQACRGLSWTYDTWGNRTNQAVTGGSCKTFSAAATSQNRLVGYQYDAAGNMTNDGAHNYTYDAENRVIKVDGGNTATYVYDAEGRRAEKITGGSWRDFIRDLNGNVVAEVSANGWQVGYVYLGSSLIAQYQNSTTYFLQSDHLGSTRLMTGADGSGQQSWDYQPFGELLQGVFSTDHLFTGKERDAESGLDNFGARYDSSSMGRFMTPDWAAKPTTVPYAKLGDPQTLNLYGYVLNNPLSKADPDGHLGCGFLLLGNCPQVPPPPAPPAPSVTTKEPTVNVPGPQFRTKDGAAKTAIRTTNPQSVRENKEIAGRVVRNANGTYGTTRGPESGRAPASADQGPVPAGTVNAGIWHDHGGPDPRFDNEHFSDVGGDKELSRTEGVPIYVGTPGGTIRKYDPATNQDTQIGATPH